MPRADAVSLPTVPILGSVRPVMDRLDFHEPGIGLEQAARQYGIETDQLVKLNSNECCYGPAARPIRAGRYSCASTSAMLMLAFMASPITITRGIMAP